MSIDHKLTLPKSEVSLVRGEEDDNTGVGKGEVGCGKGIEIAIPCAAPKRASGHELLWRKLSTYVCGGVWSTHRRMDAGGDERRGAAAGKLAGRLRMNGTNV